MLINGIFEGMIKATELRIGNWILGASRLQPVQATAKMIAQLEEGLFVVQPIPLTPEILDRCGIFLGSRIEVWIESTQLSRSIVIDGGFNGGIKYLHQLQNIYFALTETELEIKQPVAC